MSLRFTTQTALGAVIATLICASSAYADSGYVPYYQQNRENYQFESVAPPVENGMVAPLPPSAPPTNWQPVKPVPFVPMPVTLPLGTLSGLALGLQASYYHYNEPSPNVVLSGPQMGIIGGATVVSHSHLFDAFDFRYAYGDMSYSSNANGSSNDHGNQTWEIRDVIGQDFIWDRYALSPYVGVGYRNLYSDDRGYASLGGFGYQRLSQYLYVPIGVKPQIRIDGADRLSMNFEFDYLAHGWQTSHLGDSGDGDPTIRNGQPGGVGFRGEAMWDTGTWAFGPFFNLWNVNSSNGTIFHSPNATCGGTTCVGTEPDNVTVEGGLQLRYHFLNF